MLVARFILNVPAGRRADVVAKVLFWSPNNIQKVISPLGPGFGLVTITILVVVAVSPPVSVTL